MQNYNQQQQAVILKGIAQQLLSMSVPSFQEAIKLFNHFEIYLENDDVSKISMAIEKGIIQKSGTWLSVNGAKIGQLYGNELTYSKNGKGEFYLALANYYTLQDNK